MPATAKPRVKPPALKLGDVVGIVAPASDITRDLLESGCEALRKLGYKPFYFDSILQQDLYFAGSHERRAQELQEILASGRCCRGQQKGSSTVVACPCWSGHSVLHTKFKPREPSSSSKMSPPSRTRLTAC